MIGRKISERCVDTVSSEEAVVHLDLLVQLPGESSILGRFAGINTRFSLNRAELWDWCFSRDPQ